MTGLAAYDRARLGDPDLYRFWQEDQVRYADLDANGHANNNAIGAFFEDARVGLVAQVGLFGTPDRVMVLCRTEYEFLAEIHHGARLRIGLGIMAIGTTSLSVAGGIFVDGTIAALHAATLVLIDGTTRRPTPLPDEARAALVPFQL